MLAINAAIHLTQPSRPLKEWNCAMKKTAVNLDYLSRSPPSRYFDPFRQTAPLLALNINDVGIAFAPASDTILLH